MASLLNEDSLMEKDSGTAAAVAVIMLLAVIMLAAGVWAAVVLPAEAEEAREAEIAQAKTALEDTVFLLDALSDVSFAAETTVFTALPAGTIQTKTLGMLKTGNGHTVPLTSLTCSGFGGTALGISAGGVWRKDGGDAAWNLFPKTAYETGHLAFSLPVFTRDVAYGSSEMIPLGFQYLSTGRCEETGEYLFLTVASSESWVLDLWETVFAEAVFSAEGRLHAEISRNSESVQAVFTADAGMLTVSVEEKRYAVFAGGKA